MNPVTFNVVASALKVRDKKNRRENFRSILRTNLKTPFYLKTGSKFGIFQALPLTYEIDARFGRLNRDKWYYAANYPSKNRIAFVSDMTLDGDELLIGRINKFSFLRI